MNAAEKGARLALFGPRPRLMAGGGDGSLKGNRYRSYPKGTPMTNLLLTLLDRAGVHPEKIGDSNGRLEHISI